MKNVFLGDWYNSLALSDFECFLAAVHMNQWLMVCAHF